MKKKIMRNVEFPICIVSESDVVGRGEACDLCEPGPSAPLVRCSSLFYG